MFDSDPFVSYAQNFEDVMLWRALQSVGTGFYVDVGAWSPDDDSVTRAFYERGWRGINVEPNPRFTARYAERRPRDITLPIALGQTAGRALIYLLPESGLSTMDADLARQGAGATPLEPTELEVSTLARVLAEHASGLDVHFLKVDVEGFEAQVLAGNDWSIYRPWVVVVESTLPNSREEAHDTWEPGLLAADYVLAYADGLNRFYVSREKISLAQAFRYPPNVFDHFKNVRQAVAEERAVTLDVQNQTLTALVREAEATQTILREQIATLTAQYNHADVDRVERAKQIDELTRLIHESEADRAARGEQIDTLTRLIHECEADRAEKDAKIAALSRRGIGRFLGR